MIHSEIMVKHTLKTLATDLQISTFKPYGYDVNKTADVQKKWFLVGENLAQRC